MKERILIGDRSVPESLALWGILILLAISLVLATWASISNGPRPSVPILSPTPTQTASRTQTPNSVIPVTSPGVTREDQISASEALEPFFGDGRPNIALLVSTVGSPTEREVGWLADISFELGLVEAVSYSGASFETLSEFQTLFVIDLNSDFDPSVLSLLSDSGVTIHLIGAAAGYGDSIDLETEVD